MSLETLRWRDNKQLKLLRYGSKILHKTNIHHNLYKAIIVSLESSIIFQPENISSEISAKTVGAKKHTYECVMNQFNLLKKELNFLESEKKSLQ